MTEVSVEVLGAVMAALPWGYTRHISAIAAEARVTLAECRAALEYLRGRNMVKEPNADHWQKKRIKDK